MRGFIFRIFVQLPCPLGRGFRMTNYLFLRALALFFIFFQFVNDFEKIFKRAKALTNNILHFLNPRPEGRGNWKLFLFSCPAL